jgi:hypothetical protein
VKHLAHLLFLVLAAACTPPGPAAPPAAAAVADLPLRRSFYVTSDTACGEASNATLALLHREGLNFARADCVFTAVTARGDGRYRVADQCTEIGTGERYTGDAEWQVLSAESFALGAGDGSPRRYRYCDQAALPEGWRDIGLAAAIAHAPDR